jgi:hypothetical protein
MGDDRRNKKNDPLVRARSELSSEPGRLKELENKVEQELNVALSSVFEEDNR